MGNRFKTTAIVAVCMIGLGLGIVYGLRLFSHAADVGGARNGSTSASTPETAVRIGSFSTAIDYGPLFIAKAKGWFDEELKRVGARPEYTEFQTLPSITEALASKQIDIVFEAEPPAIIAKAGGNDVRIGGISCSLRQEVIVPAKSSISKIADLKGKKAAVLAGTSSHYALLKIAQSAGLSPSDISVVDMVPPDAKAAFSRGEVDAWAVWPPWVEQEIVAGTGKPVPASEALIHSIITFRGGFLTAHPEQSQAAIRAVERARSWMLQNPDDAKRLLAEQLRLPVEVVALAWPKHNWSATLSAEVVADIQRKADFLVELKRIRNHVDAAELVQPIAAKGK